MGYVGGHFSIYNYIYIFFKVRYHKKSYLFSYFLEMAKTFHDSCTKILLKKVKNISSTHTIACLAHLGCPTCLGAHAAPLGTTSCLVASNFFDRFMMPRWDKVINNRKFIQRRSLRWAKLTFDSYYWASWTIIYLSHWGVSSGSISSASSQVDLIAASTWEVGNQPRMAKYIHNIHLEQGQLTEVLHLSLVLDFFWLETKSKISAR